MLYVSRQLCLLRYGDHHILSFLIVPPCIGLRWFLDPVIIFLTYLSKHITTAKHPKQNKWFDEQRNQSSMLPSSKTLLYDAFAHAFGLRYSFLQLLSKTTHLFACKTNRTVAGVLQSIVNNYACLVSQRFEPELSVQVKNVFLSYGSTRVTCRNTLSNNSDDRRFVSQTCFHCQHYCVSLCIQPVT